MSISQGLEVFGSNRFAVFVPADPRTYAYEVVRGNTVLATRTRSATAPSVSFDPVDGIVIDTTNHRFRLHWHSSDADVGSDAIRHLVEYSRDGSRWIVLAVHETGQTLSLPLGEFAGGSQARVRVIASDGFRSTTVQSVPFAMPDASPTGEIISPVDGQTFRWVDAISLSGYASDPEDGPMPQTAIKFRSNVAGDLISGVGHVEARQLGAGWHTITMTSTDSAGQTHERSVQILIEAAVASLPRPDVHLDTVPVQNFRPGEEVTVTLVASNVGDAPVPAASTWSFVVPDSVELESATSEDWTCVIGGAGASCTYIGPTWVPSALSSMVVRLRPSTNRARPYPIDVFGFVAVPGDANQRDNAVRISGTVVDTPSAELAMTRTDPDAWVVGERANVRFDIRNIGTAPYQGSAQFSFEFLAERQLVGASGEGWTCQIDSQRMSCTSVSSTLAPGASFPTLFAEVLVLASSSGTRVDGGGVDAGVPVDAGGQSGVDAGNDASDASAPSGPDLALTGGDPCQFDPRYALTCGDPYFDIADDEYMGDGEGRTTDTYLGHSKILWHAPHQGGYWQYTLRVTNRGTDPVVGPVAVRFAVPNGATWSPFIGGIPGLSSVSGGWSCSLVGAEVVCTRPDGLAPSAYATTNLLLRIALDAPGLLPVTASAQASGDVNLTNNALSSTMTPVVQRFGPSFQERYRAPVPVESTLIADIVDAPASTTVDSLATMRVRVRNTGSTPVGSQLVLELFGATSFVDVRAVRAPGFVCERDWGRVRCKLAGAAVLQAGASSTDIEVDFVPGPNPGGSTALTASVRRDGVTQNRTTSRSASVAPSMRPDIGWVAVSGCAPYADCWPVRTPTTSGEPNHLAHIELVRLDGRDRRSLRLFHNTRNDYESWSDLGATWRSNGRGLVVFSKRGPETRLLGVDLTELARNATTVVGGQWLAVGSLAPSQAAPSLSADDAFGLLTQVAFLEATYQWGSAYGTTTTSTFYTPTGTYNRPVGDRFFEPVISRDATRIAFRRGVSPRVWIADLARTGTQLTAGTPRLLAPSASARAEYNPVFSPDGRTVAFSDGDHILTVELSDGFERVITDGGGQAESDTHPAFSADGQMILFERGQVNELPVDFEAVGNNVDRRVANHHDLILGFVPEYRDTAVFATTIAGGVPLLVSRGRAPVAQPVSASLDAAATLVAPVADDVVLGAGTETPIDGSLVSTASVSVGGTATGGRPAPAATDVVFVVDSRDGFGVNRRFSGEFERMAATHGIPSEWIFEATNPAPSRCAAMPNGTNFLDCYLREYDRSLASYPLVRSSLVRFGDDRRFPRGIVPANVLPLLDGGVQSFSAILTDSNANGFTDVEDVVRTAPFGSCSQFSGDGPMTCRTTTYASDGVDTFDRALEALNDAFATTPAATTKIAYLFSGGREHVTTSLAGPLATTRANGIVVNTLADPVRAVVGDIAVIVDLGAEDAGPAIADALRRILAITPASTTPRVALMATRDLLGSSLGSIPYQFVAEPFAARLTQPRPLCDYFGGLQSLRANFFRPYARTHVVIASRNPLIGSTIEDRLNALFPTGYIVHEIVPEGPTNRPRQSRCEPAAYGSEYIDLAEVSRGTRSSICTLDLNALVANLSADLSRSAIDPCADSSNPIAMIAKLTGGSCRVMDATAASFTAPVPWRVNSSTIQNIEVRVNGGPSVSSPVDTLGRWTVPSVALVSGWNDIDSTVLRSDGTTATQRTRVRRGSSPVAMNDSVVAQPYLASLNVLANDADPDGSTLVLASYRNGTSGMVRCAPNGACTYAYLPGERPATDTFTYVVRDADGLTSQATVTVTARANRRPIATSVTITARRDVAIAFDLVASDPDGTPVTVAPPSTPDATIQCDASWHCTYRSNVRPNSKVLTWSATDPDGESTSSTLTVNAWNDPPVATSTDVYIWPGLVTNVDLRAFVSDPDGDALDLSFTPATARATVACDSVGRCTFTGSGLPSNPIADALTAFKFRDSFGAESNIGYIRVHSDVNECATNNGGCSTNPLVACSNTIGSSTCASCPAGYTGNGITCTPIDCGAPPVPTNGYTTATNGTTFTKTATYSCNLGYSVSGTYIGTCSANGTWTGALPICAAVASYCASVSVTNGTIAFAGGAGGGTSRSLNALATFNCNTGYVRNGTATRTCVAGTASSGAWSGASPTCPVVDCGAPTAPSNGTVGTASGTTYNKAAMYSCAAGYMLVGVASRTCQADGAWSGVSPTCAPAECGSPSNPANGTVATLNGTNYNKTATYTCNVGFTLSGSATRTCLTTGLWSGSAPTCPVTACGALSNPTNGTVSLPNGNSYLQVATYSCVSGFALTGNMTRTCQANATWSGSAPTCPDINECLTSNGGCSTTPMVTCTNTTGGRTCGACPSGYAGSGVDCADINECATNNGGCGSATFYACTNNIGAAPTCADINECLTNNGGCGSAAAFSCANNLGAAATCTDIDECATNNGGCSSNAMCTNLVGSRTCACRAGFTGNGVTCTDVNECLTGNGGCGTNAVCTNTSGSRTCACSPGYTGNGFTCAQVDCLAPPSVRNGSVSSGPTTYGQWKSYSCVTGFVMSGPVSRQCQANGTWSGVPATCIQNCFTGNFDVDASAARDDHGCWIPPSGAQTSGQFTARNRDGTAIGTVAIGASGDIPLVGDFDSNGVTDIAIYSPSEMTWQAKSVAGASIFSGVWQGVLGDVPLVGDFDGDAFADDVAVYRPDGHWWAMTWDYTTILANLTFGGGTGDVPLLGDMDGNGRTNDLVIFHPGPTATWRAAKTVGTNGTTTINIAGVATYSFGTAGDRPFIGNFHTPDTVARDLGVYSSPGVIGSAATFTVRRTAGTGSTILSGYVYGYAENLPVVGDFDADGYADDLGIYDVYAHAWGAIRYDGVEIRSGMP